MLEIAHILHNVLFYICSLRTYRRPYRYRGYTTRSVSLQKWTAWTYTFPLNINISFKICANRLEIAHIMHNVLSDICRLRTYGRPYGYRRYTTRSVSLQKWTAWTRTFPIYISISVKVCANRVEIAHIMHNVLSDICSLRTYVRPYGYRRYSTRSVSLQK